MFFVGLGLALLVTVHASADLSRVAYSQLTSTATGTQDDFATIGYDVVRWNGASAVTFTGFNGAQAGRILIVDNVTAAQEMSFSNATGSTASYQLNTPNAATLTCPAKSRAIARYDSTLTKWIVSGGAACYSAGGITNPGPLYLTGEQTFTTTGTSSDVALNSTALVFRYTGSNTATITGFTGGTAGRLLIVENATAFQLTLSNETTSTAANRILGSANSNTTLNGGSSNANSAALLIYDGTSTRWRVVAQLSNLIAGSYTVSGTFAALGSIVISTHLRATGTDPTLSSCGTSPTIVGGDLAGTVVTGTGATACTITFAATYTSAPICVVSAQDGSVPPYSTTATTLVLSTAAASATYHFVCVGQV